MSSLPELGCTIAGLVAPGQVVWGWLDGQHWHVMLAPVVVREVRDLDFAFVQILGTDNQVARLFRAHSIILVEP